jgi:hypothetical protein
MGVQRMTRQPKNLKKPNKIAERKYKKHHRKSLIKSHRRSHSKKLRESREPVRAHGNSRVLDG